MSKTLPTLLCAIALAGCASTADEPVVQSDFVAAVPQVDETPRPVTIVETVTPLPLPGQMKPVPVKQARPVPPTEAIQTGRTRAQVEPSLDGYMNAVQVYPYTEGALYRLYSAPGQVSDIALQPGEELISVSPETRSAGWSGIRPPAEARDRAPMCSSSRSRRGFQPI